MTCTIAKLAIWGWMEESEEGTLADIYNTHRNKYPTLLVYCKFLVGCPCNC